MMADRRGTLNIFYNALLLIVFICCIKFIKTRYLALDGISITFNINGSFDAVAESYTSSSLFIFPATQESQKIEFGERLVKLQTTSKLLQYSNQESKNIISSEFTNRK